MKRLILSLILALGFTFSISPVANADTVTFPCGGSATYSVLMPQGVLLDGKNCSGALVVDDSVKIIDERAFLFAKVTSVSIPNSVVTIGKSAFEGTLLTSVTIPNTVVTLGENSFASSQLTSATIGNSVKSISPGTFYDTPLTSVTFGKSVTSIEYEAFRGTSLTSITIPNSVTFIGQQAFNGSKLTSVNIPNSVKIIGAGAFSGLQMSSITIGDSVTEIGIGAFEGNLALKSISIPDNLEELGAGAFDRNYSLTSILYCGKLKGFPIYPTCPPERKALMDAKPADSQTISDPRKVYVDQLSSKLSVLLKSKPDLKKVIQKTQNSLNLINLSSSASDYSFKQEILLIERQIQALEKMPTITCVKGKVTKKVSAIKPKCPADYKKK